LGGKKKGRSSAKGSSKQFGVDGELATGLAAWGAA
jgi:hypothetical protein